MCEIIYRDVCYNKFYWKGCNIDQMQCAMTLIRTLQLSRPLRACLTSNWWIRLAGSKHGEENSNRRVMAFILVLKREMQLCGKANLMTSALINTNSLILIRTDYSSFTTRFSKCFPLKKSVIAETHFSSPFLPQNLFPPQLMAPPLQDPPPPADPLLILPFLCPYFH